MIGVSMLAGIAFIGYKYIDGLASGWGSTTARDWNLTVHTYDELVADENNAINLEGIFRDRLWGSFYMHTDVQIDTATKGTVQVFVSIEDVLVPERITEEDFDPEWHGKNIRNRIDDVDFPTEYQSWNIIPLQKELIIGIIKEQIPFIADDNVIIIDDLGKWRQR